jgi:hypothetical protein
MSKVERYLILVRARYAQAMTPEIAEYIELTRVSHAILLDLSASDDVMTEALDRGQAAWMRLPEDVRAACRAIAEGL